jgi:serine protease Do
MRFSEIAVVDFSEIPGMDYEDDPEVTPIDLEAIPGVKTDYYEYLIDAVHDEELPVVYGITDSGDVVAINYETQQVKSLAFDYPAESIFYKNGNVFITLLKGEHSSYWWEEDQEGAVAIVDATTFKTKKVVDIAIDPYDIVADDTYFYVSSGSGQWTYLDSYKIETGELISRDHNNIFEESSLVIHPKGESIYAIPAWLSPRSFQVFQLHDGEISNSSYARDSGEFDLIQQMKVSSDGKYIFNFSGDVFRATSFGETMTHVTNIGTMFYDVTFNESNTEFYVSVDDLLYVYDYESFTPTKTYSLSGDGYFLFTHKGKVITVGEETNNAGVISTFIQTSDLTNK